MESILIQVFKDRPWIVLGIVTVVATARYRPMRQFLNVVLGDIAMRLSGVPPAERHERAVDFLRIQDSRPRLLDKMRRRRLEAEARAALLARLSAVPDSDFEKGKGGSAEGDPPEAA